MKGQRTAGRCEASGTRPSGPQDRVAKCSAVVGSSSATTVARPPPRGVSLLGYLFLGHRCIPMGRKTRHTSTQVKAMLEEINQQTDRGAAVIAAAALDELLDVCIQNRLLEMNRERYDALFSFERPLGSFSAKIELGMALGFYSKAGYESLHIIRDIRNKFSHKIEPISFDHEDIRKIVDQHWGSRFKGKSRRDKFETVFHIMAMLLTAVQLDDIRIKSLARLTPRFSYNLFHSFRPKRETRKRNSARSVRSEAGKISLMSSTFQAPVSSFRS